MRLKILTGEGADGADATQLPSASVGFRLLPFWVFSAPPTCVWKKMCGGDFEKPHREGGDFGLI